MSEAFVRPFRPVELTASTLTSFPLQAMAQQLMTEDAFQTSGRNALTLIHHPNLTVVLTVLRAGAVLDEHHAPLRSRCCRYLARSFSHQHREQPVSRLPRGLGQSLRHTCPIGLRHSRTVRFSS